MKPSDDMKTRFLDMQQHPENYTDDQLEAMMAELDQPVDAEAAWEEFSKKNIAADTTSKTHKVSQKHSALRWWWAVAAIIAIAFGVWTLMPSLNRLADRQLAENTEKETVSVSNEKNIDDKPQSTTTLADNTKLNNEEQFLAQNTETSKGKPTAKPTTKPIDKAAGHAAKDGAANELAEEMTTEEEGSTFAVNPYNIIIGNPGNMVAGGLSGTGAAYRGFGSSSSASVHYDGDHIYEGPEQMPSFPGGDEALYQWVYDHMQYPEECKEQGIQGRVMVQLVIGKDGSIESAQAPRSPHEALSKEAIRLVKSMPKWVPGRHNGRMVRSYLYLPITFRIQ